MTIKQHGGIFGRNPTFNNVTVDGTLTVDQIAEKTGAAGITLDGVTLKDGNVVLANGKGIDFSATSGTGTSELFDDYEEGTWTPAYTTDGTDFGSVTYDSSNSGRYVKVGNVVHVVGKIITDAITVGSASGNIMISGLPFTPASNGTGGLAIGYAGDFAGDIPSSINVISSNTSMYVRYRSAANGATLTLQVADMGTGTNDNEIQFSGSYIVG